MSQKQYSEQLLRLQEEQKKALQDTDDQINQWLKFRSDYDALRKQLNTLPDQVTHDVMVPFGKMAFMPGRLVHTNEILVLLGDNWFVERSTKQAVGIVDRRMKAVDKQLEELKKQRQLLEPRQQFTSELQHISKEDGDVMEIREEYDEAKEKQWKEAHRKHVIEYRRKLKSEAEKQTASQISQESEGTSPTDEELWARLDQLERIESERMEMLKIGTVAEKKLSGYQFPAFQGREGNQSVERVTHEVESDHSDTVDEESSYTASDELDSDDDEVRVRKNSAEEVESKGRQITFSHSQTSESQHLPKLESGSEDLPVISPGDIYSRYIKELKPKSILKKTFPEQKKKVRHKTKKPVVAFDTGSEDEHVYKKEIPNQQSLEPAFSAVVVEKSASDIPLPPWPVESKRPMSKFKSRTTSESKGFKEPSKDMTNQKDSTTEKPVSKFKAQRQMIER